MSTDLQTLIQTYGYWAILGGTFLEGETILILAGFAAHRGYLDLPWVIVAAFFGTLAGDQLFFFLGRRRTARFLARRPTWVPRVERATRLIGRHETLLLLGFRFLYGLRTVTPFALGASRVPVRRFVILNVIGAAVWACAIGSGGYFFGQTLETLLGKVKRYELTVIAVIAGVGVVVWAAHFWREHRAAVGQR